MYIYIYFFFLLGGGGGGGERGGGGMEGLHIKQHCIGKREITSNKAGIQIVPQKFTIGIWVSIAKEPHLESEKSNQIMKLWLFFYNSVKTPFDLAK